MPNDDAKQVSVSGVTWWNSRFYHHCELCGCCRSRKRFYFLWNLSRSGSSKRFHETEYVTRCNTCRNLFRIVVAHKFQLTVSTCNGGLTFYTCVAIRCYVKGSNISRWTKPGQYLSNILSGGLVSSINAVCICIRPVKKIFIQCQSKRNTNRFGTGEHLRNYSFAKIKKCQRSRWSNPVEPAITAVQRQSQWESVSCLHEKCPVMTIHCRSLDLFSITPVTPVHHSGRNRTVNG